MISGGRYEPVLLDNAYKSHMKLTIKSVASTDFGTYKCVVINSLGQTDGTIKLESKQLNKSFGKLLASCEFRVGKVL